MHKIFILIISLCCSVSILAQNLNLSGSVKDADTGQVLPGATILVEGSSNGTTTDFDGNFNIAVGLGETLIISYVGFKTQSRVVDNNIDLNISKKRRRIYIAHSNVFIERAYSYGHMYIQIHI